MCVKPIFNRTVISSFSVIAVINLEIGRHTEHTDPGPSSLEPARRVLSVGICRRKCLLLITD